ncbi:uncharacterized protein KQ657_000143 [Scheffersomyces spartinae]|uniref:Transcription factor domain-containing protein n=1 Tax=Scheffersomyces spartinae TaxID=45513 RepID=A0A9P7VDT6_9ASCO|nr:uncharacterized protein KQ657_000143 [Scheffersomyces spartinae]KAG7196131.1 hypothetical protein KQ657_000143 [Scheffersomyces spartinae]
MYKNTDRSNELIERLTGEVRELKDTLDKVINRKNETISKLIQASQQVSTTNQLSQPGGNAHQQRQYTQELESRTTIAAPLTIPFSMPTPESSVASPPDVDEILKCLNSPALSSSSLIPMTQTNFHFTRDESDFCITSNVNEKPVYITLKEAQFHFENYYLKYTRFLPILPDSFFSNIDLIKMNKENLLLFWSIIVTSLLNQKKSKTYFTLANHVKSLVVENCWMRTPRSVYAIASLLILTTWPLPLGKNDNFRENLSIKYISLMKSLALQFGLHKLEFINEFSHKTNVNISNEVSMNNLIRERIYKFININSNYWLIYLGLSNINYNGFQCDYIINKSNTDILTPTNNDDHYINSLLKVSLVQTRLNENLSDLVKQKGNTHAKSINLNMFDHIIEDLHTVLESNIINNDASSTNNNNLIKLGIEYSKLQLYVYSMSNDYEMSVYGFKQKMYQALNTCTTILDLFELEFINNNKNNDTTNTPWLKNFNQLPIHYRFILELVSLILIRIYKSPILNQVDDYLMVKQQFNRCYSIINTNNEDSQWNQLNAKLLKLLALVDKLPNQSILATYDVLNNHIPGQNSFFLIRLMKNHLLASLSYELIWLVYDFQEERKGTTSKSMDWKLYGLDNLQVKEFLLTNESIFIDIE